MIDVNIHPGEMKYERGADLINAAIKYADYFERPTTTENIPADMMFVKVDDCRRCGGTGWIESTPEDYECGDCLGEGWAKDVFNVEIKLPADAAQSVLSGHLAQQARNLAALGHPAAIVVWGGPQDVWQALKQSGLKGFRGNDDKVNDWKRYQAFKWDCWADLGIPVLEIPRLITQWGKYKKVATVGGVPRQVDAYKHTLVYQDPADEIFKLADKVLNGGNVTRHMNKKDGLSDPVGVLARIPNIGDDRAKGLMEHFDCLGDLVFAAKNGPLALAELKINNRKLGKAAEGITRTFWGNCN
jgi:hypothetical protein